MTIPNGINAEESSTDPFVIASVVPSVCVSSYLQDTQAHIHIHIKDIANSFLIIVCTIVLPSGSPSVYIYTAY